MWKGGPLRERFFLLFLPLKFCLQRRGGGGVECYGEGGQLGKGVANGRNEWSGLVISWLGGRKGPRSDPRSDTVFHTGIPFRHDDQPAGFLHWRQVSLPGWERPGFGTSSNQRADSGTVSSGLPGPQANSPRLTRHIRLSCTCGTRGRPHHNTREKGNWLSRATTGTHSEVLCGRLRREGGR